jgi:Lipocalin-like domain
LTSIAGFVEFPMRAAGYFLSLLSLTLSCVQASGAEGSEGVPNGVPNAAASQTTRQQLVGAWQLVGIELSGPDGQLVDPFYQANSVGMIIYDSSGRMSVQIAAPKRPASKIPAARMPGALQRGARLPGGRHEQTQKAAAFDTYYAYFGTWEYDPATSLVTHHVETSLMPIEDGSSYAQEVALEGDRLVFTVRETSGGKILMHRKVWQRIRPPPLKPSISH